MLRPSDDEEPAAAGLMDPFRSRLAHRLKHDALSVERRDWYTAHQQTIYRQYHEQQDKRESIQAAEEKEEHRKQKEELRAQEKALEDSADHASQAVARPPITTWLTALRRPTRRPKMCMLCFPDVGCAPGMFDSLLPHVAHIQGNVYGVCLPGRYHRIFEPLADMSVSSILACVRVELLSLLEYFSPDEPSLVFVGHGLGAVLAFETARVLQAERIAVAQVIACASRSPIAISEATLDHRKPWGAKSTPPLPAGIPLLHDMLAQGYLPDVDLAQRRDLMRVLTPVLDADMRLLREYVCLPPLVPAVPIDTQLREGFTVDDCAETLQGMGVYVYKLSASLCAVYGVPEPWQTADQFEAWEALTHGSFDLHACDRHGRCVLACTDCLQTIAHVAGRCLSSDEDDPSLADDSQEQPGSARNGPLDATSIAESVASSSLSLAEPP